MSTDSPKAQITWTITSFEQTPDLREISLLSRPSSRARAQPLLYGLPHAVQSRSDSRTLNIDPFALLRTISCSKDYESILNTTLSGALSSHTSATTSYSTQILLRHLLESVRTFRRIFLQMTPARY
jgi:hypothetical protein